MRSDPRFPRACINMSQEVEGHGIFKENPKLSGKWLESVEKETKFSTSSTRRQKHLPFEDVKEVKSRFKRSEKDQKETCRLHA